MKSLAEARIKRVRALELAAEGMSYDDIAIAVGFTHRGSAHRAVSKALNEREVAAAEELRRLEGARLDALQVALWPSAVVGDVHAVTGVVKIIEARIRLFGLNDQLRRESPSSPAYLVRSSSEIK